jgi:hypothetical protein
MSFARNFALGAQAAGDILDTYYDSREKKQLRDVREAKVEDIPNAYTSQDAEQLRMLAGVKDAQGNPYYKLDANQDGSYGLRANFAYQGQDGQMVEPGGVATTFAPRANTASFMGTRYAPEDLNEDRIAAIRARAMADVIAERDPVRGLAMRQSVKAGERDDKRFGWEEQQQPLKQRGLEQQVRQGDITLGQSERGVKVQELVDEVSKMPIEAIKQYAARLNTNESTLPFLMVGQDKNGYKFVTIDPKTGTPLGKEFTANEAQLRELAAASVLGMAGYGQESMTRLSAVNKDIADIVDKMNRTTTAVVSSENDATKGGRADQRGDRQVAVSEQNARTNEQYRRWVQSRGDRQDAALGAADEYQKKVDGVLEGYQAAVAAGPAGRQAAAIYAREYDQLRATPPNVRGLKVPPSLASLNAAQKGEGVSKPVKVEDAGQAYLVDGQLRWTDGRGGYIAENGILPLERSVALARAGVPENLIPQLPWNQDGTSVGFRGRSYDVNDKEDMRQLMKDYRTLGANDRLVDELQKMPNGQAPSSGFGPKITYRPDPRAPSIYAGEEDWANYRVLQNQGR